jgi:uncharacterized protein YifE (UPF0438 family)
MSRLLFFIFVGFIHSVQAAQTIYTNYRDGIEAANKEKVNVILVFQEKAQPPVPINEYNEELSRHVVITVPIDYRLHDKSSLIEYFQVLENKSGFAYLENRGVDDFTAIRFLKGSEYSPEVFEHRILGIRKYLTVMAPERKAIVKSLLPKVDSKEIESVLKDPETMWYDSESMPHCYQDAVPPITGIRPNSSQLSASVSPFFENLNFPFPLDKTGGTRNVGSLYIANFLKLPKVNGSKLPVIYWREGILFRWLFPRNTIIGEVIFRKFPDGTFLAQEIRIGKRDKTSWDADAYRPFVNAERAAKDVEKNWKKYEMSSEEKKDLLAYLKDNNSLTPEHVVDNRYGVYSASGVRDVFPPMRQGLIKKFLTGVFRSSHGEYWKTNGKDYCYCPTGSSENSLFPPNYEAGVLPVDSANCTKCHEQTGKPIANFNGALVLYGHVWGNDHRFSWHPFRPEVISDIGDFGAGGYGEDVLRQDFIQAGYLAAYNPAIHTQEYYIPIQN